MTLQVKGEYQQASTVETSGSETKLVGRNKLKRSFSKSELDRMRKNVAKYASPSCIKKNGCKVKFELGGTDEEKNMKYEVSILVRDFLKRNGPKISEWVSELQQEGCVVLPNVFYTEAIEHDAEELLRFFRCSQNILKDIEDEDESFWVHIRNAEDENPETHLRYQTVNGAYLWLKSYYPAKLKLKLKIDLYVASLTEGLGILGNNSQHEISRYGSTLLLSRPGCAEQIPHTDYSSKYFKYTSDLTPGYFVMFGGRNGMSLNIWRGSHLTSVSKIPEELQHQLGKTFKKEVLYVPPGAMLVCRGDLVHSGTAYPKEEKMASIRYHLMFDREDMQVDDVIEPREEFRQNEKGDFTLQIESGKRKRKNPSLRPVKGVKRKRRFR